MDVVVKGRKAKVSPRMRERVERKMSHLSRLDHGIERVEVEVIEEAPRVNGGHRVEASAWTPRRTFRASGTGTDVEAALDAVVDRLERQLTEAHGKRRARMIEGASRVKSGGLPPGPAEPPAEDDEEF